MSEMCLVRPALRRTVGRGPVSCTAPPSARPGGLPSQRALLAIFRRRLCRSPRPAQMAESGRRTSRAQNGARRVEPEAPAPRGSGRRRRAGDEPQEERAPVPVPRVGRRDTPHVRAVAPRDLGSGSGDERFRRSGFPGAGRGESPPAGLIPDNDRLRKTGAGSVRLFCGLARCIRASHLPVHGHAAGLARPVLADAGPERRARAPGGRRRIREEPAARADGSAINSFGRRRWQSSSGSQHSSVTVRRLDSARGYCPRASAAAPNSKSDSRASNLRRAPPLPQ